MVDEPPTNWWINTHQVFLTDVFCPQCGCNLKGTAEPVCPECGSRFDHQEAPAAQMRRPSPPLRSILCRMYLHPFGFWNRPEVEGTAGLGFLQIVLLYALGAAICVNIVRYWKGWGSPTGLIHEAWILFAPTVGLAYLQVILCAVLLVPFKPSAARLDALAVATYSMCWFYPPFFVLLAGRLLVGKITYSDTVVYHGLPQPLLLWTATALCLLWAITLYRGSCLAAGGRWWVGLSCVLCNPLWALLAWVQFS